MTCRRLYARFRRTGSGGPASRSGRRWRCTGQPEFNKSHIPAFLADEEPRRLRVASTRSSGSYEWYLLDPTRSGVPCSPSTA